MWSLVKILNEKIAKKSGYNKAKKKTFKPQLDLLEARVTPSTAPTKVVFEIEPQIDKFEYTENGKFKQIEQVKEQYTNLFFAYTEEFWVKYFYNNPSELEVYRKKFDQNFDGKKLSEMVEKMIFPTGSKGWNSDYSDISNLISRLISDVNKELNSFYYKKIKEPSWNFNDPQLPKYINADKENPFLFSAKEVTRTRDIFAETQELTKKSRLDKFLNSKTKMEKKPHIPVIFDGNSYQDSVHGYVYGFAYQAHPGGNLANSIYVSVPNHITNIIKSEGRGNYKDLVKVLANTVVHEFGHAVGLEHPVIEYLNKDKKTIESWDINTKNIMTYGSALGMIGSNFVDSNFGLFNLKDGKTIGSIQNSFTELNNSLNEKWAIYKDQPKSNLEFYKPIIVQTEEPLSINKSWDIQIVNSSLKNLKTSIETQITNSLMIQLGINNPAFTSIFSGMLQGIEVNLPLPKFGFSNFEELENWLKTKTSDYEFDRFSEKTLFQAVSVASGSFNFDATKLNYNQDYLKSFGIDDSSLSRLNNWILSSGFEGSGNLSFEFQFGMDSAGAFYVPTNDVKAYFELNDSTNSFLDNSIPFLEIDPELNANFLLSASLGEFGEREYSAPGLISFVIEGDVSVGLEGEYAVPWNSDEPLPFSFIYRQSYDQSSNNFVNDTEIEGLDVQSLENSLNGILGEKLLNSITIGASNIGRDLLPAGVLPGNFGVTLSQSLGEITNQIRDFGWDLLDSLDSVIDSGISVDQFLNNPASLFNPKMSLTGTLPFQYESPQTSFSIAIGSTGIEQKFEGKLNLNGEVYVQADFKFNPESSLPIPFDLLDSTTVEVRLNSNGNLNASFSPLPGVLDVTGSANLSFGNSGGSPLVLSWSPGNPVHFSDGLIQFKADLTALILNTIDIKIGAEIILQPSKNKENIEIVKYQTTSNLDDVKGQVVSKINEKMGDLRKIVLNKVNDSNSISPEAKKILGIVTKGMGAILPFGDNILSLASMDLERVNELVKPFQISVGNSLNSVDDLLPFTEGKIEDKKEYTEKSILDIRFPLRDSTPAGLIADFLLGKTKDVTLVQATLNPEFELSDSLPEFNLTPDTFLGGIGIVNLFGQVSIKPSVKVGSKMIFGLDLNGLYVDSESRPIYANLAIEPNIALKGNLVGGVNVAAIQAGIKIGLEDYGLRFNKTGKIYSGFDQVSFGGKFRASLEGDFWVGAEVTNWTGTMPPIGIGVQYPLTSVTIADYDINSGGNPFQPIKDELEKMAGKIKENAECAAISAIAGSSLGGGVLSPITGVIGAAIGAEYCSKNPLPDTPEEIAAAVVFAQLDISVAVAEKAIQVGQEVANAAADYRKEKIDPYTRQLDSLPGGKFVLEKLADLDKIKTEALEQVVNMTKTYILDPFKKLSRFGKATIVQGVANAKAAASQLGKSVSDFSKNTAGAVQGGLSSGGQKLQNETKKILFGLTTPDLEKIQIPALDPGEFFVFQDFNFSSKYRQTIQGDSIEIELGGNEIGEYRVVERDIILENGISTVKRFIEGPAFTERLKVFEAKRVFNNGTEVRVPNKDVYVTLINDNLLKIPDYIDFIKIKGQANVEKIYFTGRPNKGILNGNIEYESDSSNDYVVSDVPGVFNLGSGANTFIGRGGGAILSTGDGSDTVVFSNGTNFWDDYGGSNILDTSGSNFSSTHFINLIGNGELSVHGGASGEEVRVEDGSEFQIKGQFYSGNDGIWNAGSGSVIFCGDGDDRVMVSGENCKVVGEGGNDSLIGSRFDDFLDGGIGNNKIFGGLGNDQIFSSDGDSILVGGDGNDFISAGNGLNMIFGSEVDPGMDFINLKNTIFSNTFDPSGIGKTGIGSGLGNDVVLTGAGKDIVFLGLSKKGSGFWSSKTADLARFSFSSFQDVDSNIAVLGDGDDIIYGGIGKDTVNLGSGFDRAFLFGGDDYVQVTGNGDQIDCGEGDDAVKVRNANEIGRESSFNLGAGDDRLEGSDQSEIVNCGPGNDIVIPGNGDDQILGEDGLDTLVYLNISKFELSDSSVRKNAAGIDSIAGFERVVVSGTDGPGNYSIQKWAGYVGLFTGKNQDLFDIKMVGGVSKLSADIFDAGGNDSLKIVGTSEGDRVVVDRNNDDFAEVECDCVEPNASEEHHNAYKEFNVDTKVASGLEGIRFGNIENIRLNSDGGNDDLTFNWAPAGSRFITYLGDGDDNATVNFDAESAYGIQIRGGTVDISFAGQDLLEVRMKTPGALTRDLGNGGQFGTVMGSYAEGEISYIEYVGMRATTPGMTLNKAFIQSLYHNVLQRDGGPSEVDSWVPTLASFGIVGVIKRVMQSEEFSQMTVRDWYQMYLGRPASIAEMRPWIDMLKAGKSLEQVLPEMIASPEYFNRNGGTMGNFVQAVYRDFLERAGSKAEIDSWLVPLSRKMARQDMVRQVMGSVEYRRLVVQRFYSLFLRRGEDVPSTLEFPQWVERNLPSERELTSWIYNGENLSRVRNGFAASMEFFWFGR